MKYWRTFAKISDELIGLGQPVDWQRLCTHSLWGESDTSDIITTRDAENLIMNQPPVVLIIDDEVAFLEIFSAKLSQAGLKVETASNALAGIEKARELKPDLILMDVKMPGIDGLEALRKLKEDASTKNTKVVFLTSTGDPRPQAHNSDEKFAMEIGASGYVRKTDDLDVIADKIKSYINN